MIFQEKQSGNYTKKFDAESFAIFDKLLELKCFNAVQHKSFLDTFNLVEMFDLPQSYNVDRFNLKCDFTRFNPPSLNIVKGENNQGCIVISREDTAISLKDSYLELSFDATHRATGNLWADKDR